MHIYVLRRCIVGASKGRLDGCREFFEPIFSPLVAQFQLNERFAVIWQEEILVHVVDRVLNAGLSMLKDRVNNKRQKTRHVRLAHVVFGPRRSETQVCLKINELPLQAQALRVLAKKGWERWERLVTAVREGARTNRTGNAMKGQEGPVLLWPPHHCVDEVAIGD